MIVRYLVTLTDGRRFYLLDEPRARRFAETNGGVYMGLTTFPNLAAFMASH